MSTDGAEEVTPDAQWSRAIGAVTAVLAIVCSCFGTGADPALPAGIDPFVGFAKQLALMLLPH